MKKHMHVHIVTLTASNYLKSYTPYVELQTFHYVARRRPIAIMDKRAWCKNVKVFLCILFLFQTGLILFFTRYVVFVTPHQQSNDNNCNNFYYNENNYNNSNNKRNNFTLEQAKQNTSKQAKENPSNQRKSILMFIAILSAPKRIHRRNALRKSWLRQCEQLNTSCYIFTDSLDTYGKRLPDEIMVVLEQEQFLNKDLILTESPGGVNFATRYLWVIKWANRNYKFDFLLRVDDDYFICMDRLFLELPRRKVIRKLYWGYIHCAPAGNFGELKRLPLASFQFNVVLECKKPNFPCQEKAVQVYYHGLLDQENWTHVHRTLE